MFDPLGVGIITNVMFKAIQNVRPAWSFIRPLTSTAVVSTIPKKNKMPPRPLWLVKEDEIKEVFIKGGTGAGGQKINKTNSKVQLTHLPTGIVVTCQYSRSQEQNRKRARELLALKLEELENPESCRNAVLKERAQKVKQSKSKKSKRKKRKSKRRKKSRSKKIYKFAWHITELYFLSSNQTTEVR
ncbi:uncharacterized protein SPAPADRAFT_60397 [Spathaspora passalidarum NRRL Y-27907]|uniref:Prokaryotic-type class I peptide chain release factors domain-containing protein n=1 Tax=Spathaspora passalidarum (strain NRRL Y-27907 / 11-Y1) TaxID=619300 RepID=G3AL45_SPAPN|nr:uncharacterized protein SPAPADRAFT_60397 [Spathaspora passalidarum NRRL Y-27907]EGW33088.1 hypothetical protein SPAPADRAFT_60397 [Spathaspora passalidarum NRRL Y-27907]